MPVFWLGDGWPITQTATTTRSCSRGCRRSATPLTQDPVMWFKHLVIPWLVLSVSTSASTRGAAGRPAGTENEDFVRTARARG
jgi:ABC-type dipeptide/oligopeptide/nickel transport system permease component